MNISVFRPFKSGFKCTCGAAADHLGWAKCKCPDEWRREEYAIKFRWKGKQVMRSTGLTDKKEAKARGNELAKEFKGESGDVIMMALNLSALRRVFSSIGEVIDAYLAGDILVADPERNVRSLLRVVAFAKGLWLKNPAGKDRVNGVPIGDNVVNEAAIRALPASILNAQLVADYFRAAVGGKVNYREPVPQNYTINKTLRQARDVFSKRSLAMKLRDLKLPPDLHGTKLCPGFMLYPPLPICAREPNPIQPAEFAAMVAAAEELALGNSDEKLLAKINLILRQTGMRSGSLLHLHRDWLVKFSDGYILHVNKVKGGTDQYSIPVTDELAEIMLAREGYTLRDELKDRKYFIKRHTAWVKKFVPDFEAKHHQGNHRLRKSVASVCLSWFGAQGRDVASAMLGNSKEVNQMHYAKWRIDVTELMKHELRAAKRLLPQNVLPMVPADAKAS